MTLNVYRRHGSHCPGGRALHDMTYEADELRRTWKKCSCPIYASGTLNREFKRKNTARAAWPDAKAGALSQLLRRELYGVSNLDPVSYAAAIGIFAACAVLAALVPARRALRIEPLRALRHE